MGIYGNMTNNSTGEATVSTDDNTVPASLDFDVGLDTLNRRIDGTLSDRFDSRMATKEKGGDPHFTLANSPTRKDD